ncbi:Hypothetical protein D9617_12g035170 [Elsinoe fawcettii]|nr:Hypothetical protein D9617_12g035170 [Elsinoe fawcettii]
MRSPHRLLSPLRPHLFPLPRPQSRTYATIRPAPKPGQPLPKRPKPTSSPSTTSSSPPPSSPTPSALPPSSSPAVSALKAEWSPLSSRARASLPFILSLLLGLGVGGWFSTSWLATPPEPGSEADVRELGRLEKEIDDLFLVKVYRGKCVAAGRAIRGEGGGDWRELDLGTTRFAGTRGGEAGGGDTAGGTGTSAIGKVRAAELRFEAEKRAHAAQVEEREREMIAQGGVGEEGVNMGNKGGKEERLEGLRQQAEALGLTVDFGDGDGGGGDGKFGGGMVREALAGSRGLAVERAFWNKKETELVAVVYLGKGLCGWPNTVHGGFIATLMGERLGMAAELLRTEALPNSKQREGGKGEGEEADWRDLSELEIQYKKPTYAGQFYVVRAIPRMTEDGKGIDIEGVLETLEGKVTVQVHGKAAVVESAPIPETNRASWRKWLRWS